MLNEESYANELANNKHINKKIAIELFHIIYHDNHDVLSLNDDHNKNAIRNIFQHSFKRARHFDQQFHLLGTCLSISRPMYVIYDNTTTVDDRIRVSEALTKGIMQLRDEALVNSTD